MKPSEFKNPTAKLPLVITHVEGLRDYRKKLQIKNPLASVGFVPTMGALHAGHETLLAQARSENEVCVLSIFVNPTQFNDKNDFAKYPKTWEQDLAIAHKHGVDVIFAPQYEEMYPDQYQFQINEKTFSKLLCGKDRPGHFDGVLTVVMKLFQLVRPSKAYFGEKDFQQLSLIKKMVEAFFIELEIVPVATVREQSGLAMSSRNVRLSPEDKIKAANIYKIISTEKNLTEAKNKIEKLGWQIDYLTDFEGRRYTAVKVGDVRLIDNVQI